MRMRYYRAFALILKLWGNRIVHIKMARGSENCRGATPWAPQAFGWNHEGNKMNVGFC